MKGITMRVQTLLASAVAALGLVVSVQASTLTVSLKAVDLGTTSTLNGQTAHNYNIEVYVKSDQGPVAGGDGGVVGLQYDILSDQVHTGADATAQPLLQAPNKVNTAFPASVSGFSKIAPTRVDASASNGYATDADLDLDAIGGSMSDAGNGSNNFTLGQGHSAPDDLGDLIATERWDAVPSTDPLLPNHLSLFIKGAQYYNFDQSASGTNFHSNFSSVVANGVNLGTVPEPMSLGFLSLIGLAGLRRRKA
jgi:hypothetical protein